MDELLLPYGHRHVVTLGVMLIDAICSTRPDICRRDHFGVGIRHPATLLACSKLFRIVMPPQALLLIRYVVAITDTLLSLDTDLVPSLTHPLLR